MKRIFITSFSVLLVLLYVNCDYTMSEDSYNRLHKLLKDKEKRQQKLRQNTMLHTLSHTLKIIGSMYCTNYTTTLMYGMGHIVAAYAVGIKVTNFQLFPDIFGGLLHVNGRVSYIDTENPLKKIIIRTAGPLMGLPTSLLLTKWVWEKLCKAWKKLRKKNDIISFIGYCLCMHQCIHNFFSHVYNTIPTTISENRGLNGYQLAYYINQLFGRDVL